MAMVYDCFTFFNELELLDLRLRILDPVVDRFVLVESTVTFTGKPKPLVFRDNHRQFARYQAKIVHVVVEDSPRPSSPGNVWNVEHFQRNAIQRGLAVAENDSRIMVSDVDEIPYPEAVKRFAHQPGIVAFPMRLYYYYVDCLQATTWWGTVMASAGDNITPQRMRDMRGNSPVLADQLGWHFSFLGGVERIREKLGAFAETQVNTSRSNDRAHIVECMESGKDLFDRSNPEAQKRFVAIDDTYPPHIHAWLAEYPGMRRCLDA